MFNAAAQGQSRIDLLTTARLLGVAPEDLIGGLNLVEASRLLGIAPSTLRARALDGQIGAQRDGRAWRFYWWHLAEYLQVREMPPAKGEPHDERAPPATASPVAFEWDRDESERLAEARELGLI